MNYRRRLPIWRWLANEFLHFVPESALWVTNTLAFCINEDEFKLYAEQECQNSVVRICDGIMISFTWLAFEIATRSNWWANMICKFVLSVGGTLAFKFAFLATSAVSLLLLLLLLVSPDDEAVFLLRIGLIARDDRALPTRKCYEVLADFIPEGSCVWIFPPCEISQRVHYPGMGFQPWPNIWD